MRKVELRMNEDYKYKIIKKLVETKGNKNAVCVKLNCSRRTVDRLIIKYNLEGKSGFIHGNRNRKPASTIDNQIKQKTIQLYMNDFGDANFTHFCEIIKEEHNISISDTTLNHWLRDEFVTSPKAKRKTKTLVKKMLNSLLDETKSEKIKNHIKEAIHIVDSQDAHPRRPRCKFFGEMIQMDASSFYWINGQLWHLHVAIDDATGEVVGAYFDTQETLNGYYNVLYQILNNYGIPAMFYTDKRTVFEYIRKNTAFDDEDTFTQFSYACHQLGIEIKTTSVAQAKGRVERLNQTLQSRLPVDLRRANITNIEAANEFLKSYLKKFNEQFALQLNTTKSVFEKQPSSEKINCLLAVLSPRVIDSGHSIKYHHKVYIPSSSTGIITCFKNKTDCMVIEAFDGELYVNVLDTIYLMKEIPKHELYSKEFESTSTEPKPKKKYVPPMDHPWRTGDFLNFIAKQKHRNNGANV